MTTNDTREHIAILGGGMASIMTAFELTATEALRQKYRVSIYQMGWRLGGKLASGANTENHYRNEEHGLHVWFGFYDNAFGALKKCYSELSAIQPNFLYPNVSDAFKARDYTPIGHRTYEPDGYGFWDFSWPKNSGTPGECTEEFEGSLELIEQLVRFIWKMIKQVVGGSTAFVQPDERFDKHFVNYRAAMEEIGETPAVMAPDSIDDVFEAMVHWFRSGDERRETFARHEAADLRDFIDSAHGFLEGLFGEIEFKKPDSWPILSALSINGAIMKGFLNPKYGLLEDLNLNRIDEWDLREWLIENGANRSIVEGSSILRALYDIPFAYENGDIEKPNFAAGASLRWGIRTFLTYRGHAMYVPQAGFGEAVIAPYYKVLEERGVEFNFFHKVSGIELSSDKSQVQKLRFEIQAETTDASPYEPVTYEDNLFRWPIEPDWSQLKNGDTLKNKGVNFESHWDEEPPVGELVLENGSDFDQVVLGIAGTAMKKRNDSDTLFCQELIDASPQFAAWTGNLGAVSTSGVQFWFTKAVTELGWKDRPATVGGPEPTDVWADMSQVLKTEHWKNMENPPKSLHYLCGPLPTTLFNEPETATDVPKKAAALCHKVTLEWLNQNGIYDWPLAKDNDGNFDWSVLYDEDNAVGEDRLNAQFLRANIDPTECCGNSFAGTTRYRPDASTRILANLRVVGSDTNTGINVTCVEGATISGLKASRSICGSPEKICTEHFMNGPFPNPELNPTT